MVSLKWEKRWKDFGFSWCGFSALVFLPIFAYLVSIPFIFLCENWINPKRLLPQDLVRYFLLEDVSLFFDLADHFNCPFG